MEDNGPSGNQVAASFSTPQSTHTHTHIHKHTYTHTNYMVTLKQEGERANFKWQEALETSKLT